MIPFLLKIFIQNDNLVQLGNKPEHKLFPPLRVSLHQPQAVAEEEGEHHHQQGCVITDHVLAEVYIQY